MRGLLSVSLLPLIASASPFRIGTIHHDAAPILSSVDAREIPDSYMVVFKKHVELDDVTAHHRWVQEIHASSQNERLELRKRSQFPFVDDLFEGLKHTFHIPTGLTGYSGHFDEATIEQIRRHPDVSLPPFAASQLGGGDRLGSKLT
jgi:cerevisin